MNDRKSSEWWISGILREGLGHCLLATAMWWMLMSWDSLWSLLLSSPAGPAALAVAAFWLGREERDFEIEAGPYLWRKYGFIRPWPLAPATKWDASGFRHSLSGWVPVCIVMAILWGVFR